MLGGMRGWLLCCWTILAPAWGLSAPTAQARYEREVSLTLIEREGWSLDLEPDGKRVRQVHTLRLPVFLAGEGAWLTGLNHLHVTTKPHIISRESRLSPQGRYTAESALETERNLRGTGLFTFVQVVAAQPRRQHDAPPVTSSDEVDVLIVTRELWSLRLESSFEYLGEGLNSLSLSLTERNLAGQRQQLSLQASLTPFTISTGLSWMDPRFGPDLSAGVNAGVIWGRESGAREGEYIGLSVARPLYHQDQPWALSVAAQGVQRLSRLTRGVEVLRDEPNEAGEAPLPIEWYARSYSLSLGATRQWSGHLQKRLGLTLGGGVTERTLPSTLSEERARVWRRDYLAPDRVQLGPTVSYRLYQRRFPALSHLSRYGLSEDLQLGGSVSGSLGVSIWGDLATLPAVQGQWTARWGGEGARAGFWRLSVSGQLRGQPRDIEPQGGWEWVNRGIGAQFVGASPQLPTVGGRFVWSGVLGGLWGDINNSVVSLGGSQGLRGYPAQALFAQSAHQGRVNVEYRSAPWAWRFLHLGGAVFYDAGFVGRTAEDAQAGQATGLGLRLLFPQLNRSVFRLDIASPIGDLGSPQVSFTSSQAFAVMPWEVIL